MKTPSTFWCSNVPTIPVAYLLIVLTTNILVAEVYSSYSLNIINHFLLNFFGAYHFSIIITSVLLFSYLPRLSGSALQLRYFTSWYGAETSISNLKVSYNNSSHLSRMNSTTANVSTTEKEDYSSFPYFETHNFEVWARQFRTLADSTDECSIAFLPEPQRPTDEDGFPGDQTPDKLRELAKANLSGRQQTSNLPGC